MRKKLIFIGLLIAVVLALTACAAPAPAATGDSAALAEAQAKLAAAEEKLSAAEAQLAEAGAAAPSEESGDKLKFTFIIYTAADVEFFVPTVNGVKEAADLFGVDVDIQYGDGDLVKENDLMEAAIANQVDGIAVSIPDDDALDEVICKAMDAGIPVVSFNNDDSQGAAGNCRMAYMGQNMDATGYVIAKRMIAEHGISEGDLVFTPVEWPEAIYATLRQNGVNRALQEVGAVSETVKTTSNPADAQTAMVQYLLGHPETKAIIALGLTPNTVAAAAADEAGLGDIPIGGFDLSMDIVDGLRSGRITATVDQQPYSQGFYPIAQLYLYNKYGLYPSDMDTGGLGLVDGSSVDVVAPLVGTYR